MTNHKIKPGTPLTLADTQGGNGSNKGPGAGSPRDDAAVPDYRSTPLGSEMAVSVSLLRASCVRLGAALLHVHTGRHCEALKASVASAERDPLPEVRFTLLQGH